MCTEKFGVSGGVIREVLMGKRKGRYGDGSVFQRKSDGRWCGKLTITDPAAGKKKTKTFYGATEAVAASKMREFKNDPLSRTSEFVSDADAARYIRQWLDEYKKPRIKDTTYDRYDRDLREHIEPFLTGVRLKDVSSNMCNAFIGSLKDSGLHYSTVKKNYVLLKSCFSFAVDSQDLQRNPMNTVSLPQKELFIMESIEEEHHLTEDEEKRFLEEVGRKYKTGEYVYRYHAAFLLALNTGMRIGEIVALDWADIDLAEKISI